MKALFILSLFTLSFPLLAQDGGVTTTPEKQVYNCYMGTHYELEQNPDRSTNVGWDEYRKDAITSTCSEDLNNQADNILVDINADLQGLVDSNVTNDYYIRTQGQVYDNIFQQYYDVDYKDIWQICRTRNEEFRIRGADTFWADEVPYSQLGNGNTTYNDCTQKDEVYPSFYDEDRCLEQIKCKVRNWNQSCKEGRDCRLNYTLEPRPVYKTFISYSIRDHSITCDGFLPSCTDADKVTPKRTVPKVKIPDPVPPAVAKPKKTIPSPDDDTLPADTTNPPKDDSADDDSPATDPKQCLTEESQVAFWLQKNGKNNVGDYLTPDGCREHILKPHWDAYDKDRNPISYKKVEEYYKQKDKWPELQENSGEIPPNVGYLEGPDGAMYAVQSDGSAIKEGISTESVTNARGCIAVHVSASSCGKTIIGSDAGVRNDQ